jgi:4-diphosphocytidyl-2-C-methyl-D-erythritol kinase
MNPVLECLAPAKLNLFLHVVGRRDDGRHLLQTVFQLIDLADRLTIEDRADGLIERVGGAAGVAAGDDLCVRAARMLQTATGCSRGARITLEKRIPLGGGLGGGSSDAASTLIALNRLWKIGFSRARLMKLGLLLGADIPFFIFGQNAFAEGVGEELVAIRTPARFFCVIHPGVAVPTKVVFGAPELTRNTSKLKMPDFCASAGPGHLPVLEQDFGHNDLESAAVARFAEVGAALSWLGRFGKARMSGSGACAFSAFDSREEARKPLQELPAPWVGWVCEALELHPLAHWVGD